MIYLLLAIICNCTQTVAVRFSEKNLHNRYAVTMVNYVVAALVSFLFVKDIPVFALSGDYLFPLFLGIFNGAVFITWLLIFQASVRYNGASLSTTFTKLGILIPTFGSVLFFAETPGLWQIIGIVIALGAIIIFNLPDKALSPKPQKSALKFLLIIILVIGGVGDFNSKIFENFGNPGLDSLFIFYTFLVALIISVVVWVFKDASINKRDVLFGALIGIPNQLATMFLLQSVMTLPAYLVFPAYSVGVILLISIASSLIFKERLARRQYFSIGLVCLALVCLNL